MESPDEIRLVVTPALAVRALVDGNAEGLMGTLLDAFYGDCLYWQTHAELVRDLAQAFLRKMSSWASGAYGHEPLYAQTVIITGAHAREKRAMEAAVFQPPYLEDDE